MATLVLTAIGKDQAGLVEALSGVVAEHGGNWDRSQMASLAGTFAGIVMVTVPDRAVDAFRSDLEPLEAQGLLDITVEQTTESAAPQPPRQLLLEVVGEDHPGIVHEISAVLAGANVSIIELATQTESAPMSGGRLFRATAILSASVDESLDGLHETFDDLADSLMVDVELSEMVE